MTYDLVCSPPEDITPWQLAAEAPLPFEIDYAAWPALRDLVQALNPENPEQSLATLESFFNTHSEYSLSPAVRDRYLNEAPERALVNQFLTIRSGVCSESAHAFAAIARDLCGPELPLRLVGGIVANREEMLGGHAWVEAYISGRGWVAFNPVGALQNDQTRSDGELRQLRAEIERYRARLADDRSQPEDLSVRTASSTEISLALRLQQEEIQRLVHELSPESLPPLQDVAPQRSHSEPKTLSFDAELAPAFTRALSTELEPMLFNAALDVCESFAQTPGRLDVERLVRGEVSPFVAPTVGRSRAPNTVFLSSTHGVLRAYGDSGQRETLRALLTLGVPVRVFDSAGRVTPVRTLGEAQRFWEHPPQDRLRAALHKRTLELYAEQLQSRPAAVLSLNGEDALFSRGRALWQDQVDRATPKVRERNRFPTVVRNANTLTVGNEYQGLPNVLESMREALSENASVSTLIFDSMSGKRPDYDSLELPSMPNLRALRLEGGLSFDIIIPQHDGPLHIDGHSWGSSHTVTVYARDPQQVTVSTGLMKQVCVLSSAERP